MKLYVDDIRPAPSDEWTLARTIDEAKRLLGTDTVVIASLDHDMGACPACEHEGLHIGDMTTPETTFMHWCPHASDGYGLVCWMIEYDHVPPSVYVHSMNPVGRARMLAALNTYREKWYASTN